MNKLLLVLVSLAIYAASALAQTGENLPPLGAVLVSGTTPTNGTNEVQTLTIGGVPTGGTFTITFETRKTGAITWTATDATLVANIDAAMEALPNVGTGGVATAAGTVSSGIGTVTLTFGGNRAKQDVGLATATSSLTGTSPTTVIALTTAGVEADGRISEHGTLLVGKAALSGTGALYMNVGSPPNPTWLKLAP